MWLEFRYDSDGQEYCQIYGMNLDNAEEAFRTLNDIDSPIGVFEDWYGMDLAPENGIPCDLSHEPMGCMRMVKDGMEIVDLKYFPTEEEAIEDANAAMRRCPRGSEALRHRMCVLRIQLPIRWVLGGLLRYGHIPLHRGV